MSDKMRERFERHYQVGVEAGTRDGFQAVYLKDALAFAQSEVQRALQVPNRQSGTSRAIEQLRSVYPPESEDIALVLAELDRLYAQNAQERERHAAELSELRKQVEDRQAHCRQASADLEAKGEEIRRLSREQEKRCRHLDGTPEGTQICYLHGGHIIVMGEPGDDHNCDEMGCGSVGDHVVDVLDVSALRKLQAAPGGDGERATRTVWEGWAVVIEPGKTAQPPELCVRESVARARAKTVNACGYEATVEQVEITAQRVERKTE